MIDFFIVVNPKFCSLLYMCVCIYAPSLRFQREVLCDRRLPCRAPPIALLITSKDYSDHPIHTLSVESVLQVLLS
jgi:hypothetical protein